MDILGIAYLGFESPNFKDWRDYGTEVLGLQLASSDSSDEATYLRMDDRRWRICIEPGEKNDIRFIGWEARDRPAYRAGLAKLRAAGFEVKEGDADLCAKRGVREVASFTDPVGFPHELCYGMKFHPNSFVPGRPHAGFVAEDLGVGHVVLVAPEYPDELESFLEDVMGFKWFGSGAGLGKAGFYRTKLNPLSHNIAYLAAPGLKGFHHIGLGVKTLDDVGVAYDIVRERGIQLQQTLGRHTQDPVVSFYSFTPSGFVIEYLTEGAKMTDDTFYEVNPERLSVWGHETVGPMMPETIRPVAKG